MIRIVQIAVLGFQTAAVVALAPVILLAHAAKWLDSQDSIASQRTSELSAQKRQHHPQESGGNLVTQAA